MRSARRSGPSVEEGEPRLKGNGDGTGSARGVSVRAYEGALGGGSEEGAGCVGESSRRRDEDEDEANADADAADADDTEANPRDRPSS